MSFMAEVHPSPPFFMCALSFSGRRSLEMRVSLHVPFRHGWGEQTWLLALLKPLRGLLP